jgi:hypothetical protein
VSNTLYNHTVSVLGKEGKKSSQSREQEKLDSVKKTVTEDDVFVPRRETIEKDVTKTESVTRSHTHPMKESVTKTESGTRSHTHPMKEDVTKTECVTRSHTHPMEEDVIKTESVTKTYTLNQNDTALKYDVNQNIEELPKKQSVLNMIKTYNHLSDANPSRSVSPNIGNQISRKGSATNRKSWDGVGNPSTTEENHKVSTVEKKTLKSNSDSNLMVSGRGSNILN